LRGECSLTCPICRFIGDNLARKVSALLLVVGGGSDFGLDSL
jgi:hypothetical protein